MIDIALNAFLLSSAKSGFTMVTILAAPQTAFFRLFLHVLDPFHFNTGQYRPLCGATPRSLLGTAKLFRLLSRSFFFANSSALLSKGATSWCFCLTGRVYRRRGATEVGTKDAPLDNAALAKLLAACRHKRGISCPVRTLVAEERAPAMQEGLIAV